MQNLMGAIQLLDSCTFLIVGSYDDAAETFKWMSEADFGEWRSGG